MSRLWGGGERVVSESRDSSPSRGSLSRVSSLKRRFTIDLSDSEQESTHCVEKLVYGDVCCVKKSSDISQVGF